MKQLGRVIFKARGTMSEPKLEKTQRFCDQYAEDLKKIFPNTDLHYILHYRGQKPEQIVKLMPKIHGHPAYEEAAALLKFRAPGHDNSAFLGMVIGFRKSFLGLKKYPECLAFISINMNQYETEEEVFFAVHTLTANFLETLDFYSQKHAGTQSSHILQPKRNNLATARMNLKADVFSVIRMTHQGYSDALSTLSKKRAMEALTPQSTHPEEYPLPITIDVTSYALEQYMSCPQRYPINSAFTLARQVSDSFESKNIENWINFANAAQTMAWSGYQPAQILDAATESSSNPFIKSMSNMLSEITGITPESSENIIGGFNPFAQHEVNLIAHQRAIEETFEMVLIHAMEADSHLPMIHVANNQNEGLLKGRFSGWCAHSLQSAANAYNTAAQRGMSREQAARLEFQSARQQTGWRELTQMGAHVTDMHRNGKAVTFSGLSKWCEGNPQFKAIMQSIDMTLADPTYARKLEAAAEMPTPSPKAVAEQKMARAREAAPQMGIHLAAAPPSIGLGSGMGASMGGGIATPRTANTSKVPVDQTETEVLFEE